MQHLKESFHSFHLLIKKPTFYKFWVERICLVPKVFLSLYLFYYQLPNCGAKKKKKKKLIRIIYLYASGCKKMTLFQVQLDS